MAKEATKDKMDPCGTTEEELWTTAKAKVVGLCSGALERHLADSVADRQGQALGRRKASSSGCTMKCIDTCHRRRGVATH